MLEALGALITAHRLITEAVAEAVAAVRVTVHPQYLDICNIAAPRTGLEAKFSYRQLAAMALSGAPTDRLESFSDAICADPAIAALRARVTVLTDERLSETATRVEVLTGSGAVLAADHDLAAPIALDVRRARLLTKSAALLGEAASRLLWSRISGAQGACERPGAALLSG